MTSGTTRSEVKGRHFHPTLAVYDRSMIRNFSQRFMQGHGRMRMGILFPTETVLPNSSLAHYLALALDALRHRESRYFMSPQGLDLPGLCEALSDARAARRAFRPARRQLQLRAPDRRAQAARPVVPPAGGQPGAGHRRLQGTVARTAARHLLCGAVRAARHRAIALHQHVWHDRAEHAVLRCRQCVGTLGQVRAALDPLPPGRPAHGP